MKTDIQLQHDVIEELMWDPTVGRAEIGVAAKDGVITLSGEVDTFAQKFAAEQAAKRVGGVRAVAEELRVKLPSAAERSDTELAHAAVNALRWDIQVPDDRVTVRVEDGWIALEGTVEWQYQRTAAERALRYLTGVKGLTNLITVKPRVSAADVRAKIETALERSAEIDAQRIHVEALNGTVRLTGRVRSWAERNDAEQAAWSAPGVTKVEDRLLVGT